MRRLRFQVENEYVIKSQLCRRLKRQIPEMRTIQLQPYLWLFITTNIQPDMLNNTEDLLAKQSQQPSSWLQFTPRSYRNFTHSNFTTVLPSIASTSLSWFWSTSMLLQARSLWYQVLCQKIPHTAFLYRIQAIASSISRLCREKEDTMPHFLVYCPQKKITWTMVLNYLSPTFNFASDDIFQMMHSLQSPFHYRSVLHTPFIVTLATIMRNTLVFYCQYIIHNVSFQINIVIKKCLSQISVLLGDHQPN